MCLLTLAYGVHPRFPFILASNRDEFLDRPAEPAHFWPGIPGLLAGRDEQAGGTWLGLMRAGSFALLTNYRDLRRPRVNGRSRGQLVLDVLREVPSAFAHEYEGYNLIHGPVNALRYRNNITPVDVPLAHGIHGLSNHVLDTPWPKVTRAIKGFRDIIEAPDPDIDALFELLQDPRPAADTDLPDTGVGLDRERGLSSIFIRMPGYGTRCSTVIVVGVDGLVRFQERTYDRSPSTASFELRLPPEALARPAP